MIVNSTASVAASANLLPYGESRPQHPETSSKPGSASGKAAFAGSPQDRKLRRAAGEFEAQLLSSLWKSMKTTFASSDDEDSTDPARQSLEEWGIDAMCNAIGKAGGLGVGKQIVRALEAKMERLEAAAHLPQNGTVSSQILENRFP